MEFSWHRDAWQQIERAIERDRLPHALMLEGPAGLGKGHFARRVAGRLLGHPDLASQQALQHPDLRQVGLVDERRQITVDQIRELCASLTLTSHAGSHKVAIIDPADRMNINAANSLLKTLEEPTPDTLLILIRARLDTLPATVASRCRRIRFATPATELALNWLRTRAPDHDWPRLLASADGAPLAALAAVELGHDQLEEHFAADLQAIVAGRKDPLQVAAEWNKTPSSVSLRWLGATVCQLIRERMTERAQTPSNLQTETKHLPLERLFWYLDEIQMVMGRQDGALNAQLTLDSLLVPWSDHLQSVQAGGGM